MAKPGSLKILFPTRYLLKVLTATCIILLLIHIALTICHYRWMELPWMLRELFDVDEEESIPTWFSSGVLLLVAVVLFFIYHLRRHAGDANAPYWAGLGAGFTFMSVEEGKEMGGVIFFLSGLFDYLKNSFHMEFNATPKSTK